MKRIALFLLIAVVAISSVEAQKVRRSRQKEDDGFRWYLLKQEGIYKGAEKRDGTTLIPIENKYIFITYRYGVFCATKSNAAAIYDTNGNVIIPLERGYTEIRQELARVSNQKKYIYYNVENGGKEELYRRLSGLYGLCDQNGTEIVAPVFPGHLYVDYLNGTFYYYRTYGYTTIQHYIGMKIDGQGNIVPDPDHPLGTTDKPIPENYQEEVTAYNNSNSNSNNSYRNSSYNNTYTPPAQHKQQSTGNKSTGTTQPKGTPKSSANTSSSSKPSTTRTTKERTHPFENYNKPVKCGQCSGTGMMRCFCCSGKGTIRKSGIDKNGKQVFRNERCTGCGGSGKRKCTVCNGKGTR